MFVINTYQQEQHLASNWKMLHHGYTGTSLHNHIMTSMTSYTFQQMYFLLATCNNKLW